MSPSVSDIRPFRVLYVPSALPPTTQGLCLGTLRTVWKHFTRSHTIMVTIMTSGTSSVFTVQEIRRPDDTKKKGGEGGGKHPGNIAGSCGWGGTRVPNLGHEGEKNAYIDQRSRRSFYTVWSRLSVQHCWALSEHRRDIPGTSQCHSPLVPWKRRVRRLWLRSLTLRRQRDMTIIHSIDLETRESNSLRQSKEEQGLNCPQPFISSTPYPPQQMIPKYPLMQAPVEHQ